jgi:hypothetical protein
MMYMTAYGISTTLALIGWGLLLLALFAPPLRPLAWRVSQFLIPAVLCLLYVWMVWEGRSALHLPDSFVSHAGIDALFDHPSALTAGWLHILAFDMFAGAWMAQDGLERGVPRLLLMLMLVLTFVFGPVGLLVHIVIRFVLHRRSDRASDVEAVQHQR